jgi:hypothetical protein
MQRVALLTLPVALVLTAAPARADGTTTLLHVASPYVVDVDRQALGSVVWEKMCTSPCDVPVPVDGLYRVRGVGVSASSPFALIPQGGSAIVQVTPGIKKKATAGWFIVGGAGAAVVVGAVLDAVGTGQGQVAGQGGPGDSGTTSSAKVNFYLVGTTLIIAGLAAGIYGGAMALDNAKSTVHQGGDLPAPPTSTGSSDPFVQRAEAFLDTAPRAVVPVIMGTF